MSLNLPSLLNPEQIAAVTHGEGPQLVLAGAGSGKTRVITYRIGWLVAERGVDPGAISAVTFTNKAAGEMRGRVEDLLGLYPLPTFVGTFHRYCLQMLRRYGERIGLRKDFAILDTDDQTSLMKKALAAEGLAETSFPPRAMLAAISGAKNRLLRPDDYEKQAGNFFEQKVARVYRRYQRLVEETPAVDFDDMIALAVRLLAEDEWVAERVRRRARYLLVDEFQDTNFAQLRLIHAVAGAGGNLTAVGDEDQGIYRWRGAEIENILRFEASFPGAVVRKLERNYRSTQTILDAAGEVVANNRQRRGKRLWTDAGAGDRVVLFKAGDEQDEARFTVRTIESHRAALPLSEMAILVRTNAQTRSVEEELLRREIPYTLVGGVRFYERAEIKDLVAYLRVLRNPRDELSFARVLNNPPRGIGKSTQDLLEELAAERGVPVWDYLLHDPLDRFPARAAKALGAFRDLLVELERESRELPLPAVLDRVLERTRYAEQFRRDDPDDLARLENLEEFLSAAQEFTERQGAAAAAPAAPASAGVAADAADPLPEEDSLTAFLDHVSLVSDLDKWEAERGVSLMTLHSAKGLEFKVVILGGLEDGLLPHFNAGTRTEDIEEERRLLYVGMTRARDRLYLTCCRRRRIAGRYQPQTESPFLPEVPARLLEVIESPNLYSAGPGRAVQRFFGRDEDEKQMFPDDDVKSPADRLHRNQRVRHPVLGQGVVMETDGEGVDAKVTVYFDKVGKRKLLAKYANLEIL